MAAEVYFGDLELFEPFDHPEESIPKPVHTRFKDDDGDEEDGNGVGDAELRERLRQCEETIEQLRSENILPACSTLKLCRHVIVVGDEILLLRAGQTLVVPGCRVGGLRESRCAEELKRKLNILTRPRKFGSLSHIVVFFADRGQEDRRNSARSITYFISAEVESKSLRVGKLDAKYSSSKVLGTTDLQYHQEIEEFVSNLVKRFEEQQKNDVEKTSFNLLPQPSSIVLEKDRKVEESSAMKNKEEAFSVLGFKPRNAARISEKRKEYMDACGEANNQNFQQRYHAEEVEERFGRFKPGVISEELQDALGVTDKSLPPFIYRMRQLGYPPGWLKEAELENSGLALYDGKVCPADGTDGETEVGEIQQNKSVTYDLSKLVNYPGFNISTPRGIPDVSMKSGSKRSSSHSSPGSPKKQKKESNSAGSPADMELDSAAMELSQALMEISVENMPQQLNGNVWRFPSDSTELHPGMHEGFKAVGVEEKSGITMEGKQMYTLMLHKKSVQEEVILPRVEMALFSIITVIC
ncbi:hypothetical protein P7K49_020491 [Saguinus oedipus]|uniref:PSP proline-rich domain-containing protein n=1 Tax=Saguinus oedipus TaxID=9490 RepID=A0ABQ9V0E1_SAGOE|nr:hypothetical protein P7K49_020491 [Saguinus oedipus]